MVQLDPNPANYVPLTPISFLERTTAVYPTHPAVIYGARRYTWAETHQRCRRLASALLSHCVQKGDTVAVLAPNVPAAYEAYFGVPMARAVLNAINIRLDARTVGFFLEHADVNVVIVDQEFFPLVEQAVAVAGENRKYEAPVLVVVADDSVQQQSGSSLHDALKKGAIEYEDFLSRGHPDYEWNRVDDEWEAISLCYTSRTTSSPKGEVTHHRGAYLASLSAALDWKMQKHPVHLWTLPLFHCNNFVADAARTVYHPSKR